MYNRENMFQSLMREHLEEYNRALLGTCYFYVLISNQLVLMERNTSKSGLNTWEFRRV